MAVRMTRVALEELDALAPGDRPVVLRAIKSLEAGDTEYDATYPIAGDTTAHVHRVPGTDIGLVYGLSDVDGDGIAEPVVLNVHLYGRMDQPLTPTLARAFEHAQLR